MQSCGIHIRAISQEILKISILDMSLKIDDLKSHLHLEAANKLTHLPLVRTYTSVNWVIIGSGNGLSPVWRQAITWTKADLLSIGLLGTNFSEIGVGILPFSFIKIYLKMSSAKMAAILSREN